MRSDLAVSRSAIVLCGGKSTRMGYSKPMLPFGPELMLQRVLRILSPVVNCRVVVAAKNQVLPVLPDGTLVARDEREERGPLEGILAGLRSLPGHIQTAFVTSCDVPLLRPALVNHLFEICVDQNSQIVVPKEERFHHPLTAVYRASVRAEIQDLLEADQLRPRALFDRVDTTEIDIQSLRKYDAELNSFRNLNHPEEYKKCLADSGYELDPNIRFE